MSLPLAYVDTSAFIKRFIEESGTAEIERFIAEQHYTLVLSSLSMVEIKSVLKRKVMNREVTQETAKRSLTLKLPVNQSLFKPSMLVLLKERGT
jgi:predicted nucleic acid-binding protein